MTTQGIVNYILETIHLFKHDYEVVYSLVNVYRIDYIESQ